MIARRRFLGLVGAATAWPLVARAQTSEPTVIGLLSASTAGAEPHLLDAIRRGLQQVGFVEGQNLTIEYRYADTKFDRLPALAAELVARPVAAIICSGNLAALAAKKATATIPIVFNTAGEPVAVGLLSGLNRPGSNVTGFGFFSGSLAAKRLGLLREVAPKAPDHRGAARSQLAVLCQPAQGDAGCRPHARAQAVAPAGRQRPRHRSRLQRRWTSRNRRRCWSAPARISPGTGAARSSTLPRASPSRRSTPCANG